MAKADTPDLLGDAVGKDRVEPCLGARPGNQRLRELGHVLDPDVLVNVVAFLTDEIEISKRGAKKTADKAASKGSK